jgi:hypothetical protein
MEVLGFHLDPATATVGLAILTLSLGFICSRFYYKKASLITIGSRLTNSQNQLVTIANR